MSRTTQLSGPTAYPHLSRWLAEFGSVEIGDCGHTRSFIRVLDEGGIVWKGSRRYETLDSALSDAEAGVAKWMREELGIEGTVG